MVPARKPIARFPVNMRHGRQTILLPPLQAVAASSTAFLDLPMGYCYEAIHLSYGGTTMAPANISAIRVIVNGQVIHNYSGTVRDVLNQFDKKQAAATNKILSIPFHRVNLRDGADLFTGLTTLIKCRQAPYGITSVRLEVDIASSASAPTLSAYAVVRVNDERLGRGLLRVEQFTEIVPALSAAEYRFVNKVNLDPLRPLLSRIIFPKADTEITNFRMQIDNRDIVNRPSLLNEYIQTECNFRSPQSGYVAYDTGEDGYSHPIRVADVADFPIFITVANGSYNLLVVKETIGSIGAA